MALLFVCAAVAMDLNVDDFAARLGDGLVTGARNALWVGVPGAMVLSARRRGDQAGPRARTLGHDRMYLVWLGLMSATMLWSISAGATLKAVVPVAIVWFASWRLSAVPSADAVRAVLVVAAVTAMLSLAALALFGNLAYQPISTSGAPELRGIFRHQLRLGAFMALAIGLVVIARLRGDIARIRTRSAVVNVSVVVLLSVVLLMSRARSYGGDAVIALVLTLLLSRRGVKKWMVLAVSGALFVAVVRRFDVLWSDLQDAGVDTTLTGRGDIWERTLSGVTPETRWLGHGFGTLQLPDFDFLFSSIYRAGHAHNSYIQAYFEAGTIGLGALVLLVISQLTTAWRATVRCDAYSYSLFLVLYTAIGSLTGLNYAGTLSALFSLMMLFLAIESREMLPAPQEGAATISHCPAPA
jgi:exopolysaccharide production protein ExoQ